MFVFILCPKTFKIAFRYFADNHFPLTHFFVESQGSKEKFTHSHKNFFFHQNKYLTQATSTQLLKHSHCPKVEKLFTPFLIFSFSTSLRFTFAMTYQVKVCCKEGKKLDIHLTSITFTHYYHNYENSNNKRYHTPKQHYYSNQIQGTLLQEKQDYTIVDKQKGKITKLTQTEFELDEDLQVSLF